MRSIESLRTRNYHVAVGAKKTDCAAKSRAKGTITMRRAHLLFASC